VLAGVGATFPDVQLERSVLARIDAEVLDARELPDAEVLELARGADALLTDYFDWSADAIASLERCRVICQYGVGVDRIDLSAAADAGITVTNTPDYCTDEMADHALALLLAVLRNVALYDRSVRSGIWDYKLGPQMRRLRTLTLGLVGVGRIGSAFARRARALGMSVLAVDPQRDAADLRREEIEPCELDDLLASSDAVSLHVPLTAATTHLLDRRRLTAMKPGAVLINTARGALVDQQALADVLRFGPLAGAGLDVLALEPPDPDDPLLQLDNVVMTPHAGFLSIEALRDVQTQAAEEALRVLSGEPARHAVTAAS
jgi:D-3-phosphoglycerate dehydrogenase